jgi:hypothetical protein
VLVIQLSAIIFRHDEINFHDGQVKFDLANLDEGWRSILPGETEQPGHRCKKQYQKNANRLEQLPSPEKFFG